jgi:hypothetical protein
VCLSEEKVNPIWSKITPPKTSIIYHIESITFNPKLLIIIPETGIHTHTHTHPPHTYTPYHHHPAHTYKPKTQTIKQTAGTDLESEQCYVKYL